MFVQDVCAVIYAGTQIRTKWSSSFIHVQESSGCYSDVCMQPSTNESSFVCVHVHKRLSSDEVKWVKFVTQSTEKFFASKLHLRKYDFFKRDKFHVLGENWGYKE